MLHIKILLGLSQRDRENVKPELAKLTASVDATCLSPEIECRTLDLAVDVVRLHLDLICPFVLVVLMKILLNSKSVQQSSLAEKKTLCVLTGQEMGASITLKYDLFFFKANDVYRG